MMTSRVMLTRLKSPPLTTYLRLWLQLQLAQPHL